MPTSAPVHILQQIEPFFARDGARCESTDLPSRHGRACLKPLYNSRTTVDEALIRSAAGPVDTVANTAPARAAIPNKNASNELRQRSHTEMPLAPYLLKSLQFTLNHRDFTVVRPRHVEAFTLLP